MPTEVIVTGTGVPHPRPGRAGAGVLVRHEGSPVSWTAWPMWDPFWPGHGRLNSSFAFEPWTPGIEALRIGTPLRLH